MQIKSEKSDQKQNFFQRVIRALDSISFGIGKERDYLLENISMLAAGGTTVLSAVNAVRKEVRSRNMRRILDSLAEDIESGSPLWKAFQKSRIFNEHTISLVRIGEESGRLSDNLKLIAEQEAKEREFKSKIRGAMLYPVFVLSLTLIVGVLIAWFILPRLATVFAQLDVELPVITKGLIATGTFLGEYGYVALPAFIVLIALLVFFVFFFSKTKFIGRSILFALPGIRRLIREAELSRFGYLLGTLLQAGIPVTRALNSLEKATVFPHYRKLYAYLRDSITEGNSFQKSFAGYKNVQKLIPAPVQRLIVAGEQSGNLSNTLLTVNKNFESKTEQTTKNISVILEPILLVIVWLGVVAVALAVILPIYSLVGNLNTNPSQRINEQSTQEDVVAPAESEVSTPTSTPETKEAEPVQTLRIIETGLGYLNVRDEASTAGQVVGRVYPGEEYEYTAEDVGWYEITFDLSAATSTPQAGAKDERGWVYGDYVKIIKIQTE